MIKQFSLLKFICALAIALQFSAVFSCWNPFSSNENNFNQDDFNKKMVSWLNDSETVKCRKDAFCKENLLLFILTEGTEKALAIKDVNINEEYRKKEFKRKEPKGEISKNFKLFSKIYLKMPFPNRKDDYFLIFYLIKQQRW